jgi:membrane-bound metal-dependent hydrolase YbcI (DUF457 family)
MLLFGHLGITLGVFFGLGFFIPRLRNIIDPRYMVIGALLPDLVDKPLGRVIFASSLANGRLIGHTLLFAFVVLLIGLYLYDKKRDTRVLALASGSFLHIFEDQMWAQPATYFWPLLGLRFSKDYTDYTGMEYLMKMLEKSFEPGFMEGHVTEIMGMGIMVFLTLCWLIKRLDKKNSDDIKGPRN